MIACEFSACPIDASSPATRPPPKSMKTAMPFAVAESTIEPSSDSAITITTPPASSSPGHMIRSGHQCPVSPVITIAAA